MSAQSLRVHGHLIGASSRNGIPEAATYRAGRSQLTPPQRESARRKLVEDGNRALRQRTAAYRAAAWHRDVPRSCTCDYEFAHGAAYVVTAPDPECAWHSAPAQDAARRRAVLAQADPGSTRRRSGRGAP